MSIFPRASKHPRRADGPARIGGRKYKNLPTWDEMSDLDKGAALMHVYRSTWSKSTRKTMYCKYTEHPDLVALSEKERSKHAHVVTGGHKNIFSILSKHEYNRLTKIAGYKLG